MKLPHTALSIGGYDGRESFPFQISGNQRGGGVVIFSDEYRFRDHKRTLAVCTGYLNLVLGAVLTIDTIPERNADATGS